MALASVLELAEVIKTNNIMHSKTKGATSLRKMDNYFHYQG